MKKHRLGFTQKKLRSLIKRFLTGFVNQSNTYIIQHLPESILHRNLPFLHLRSLWNYDNKKNNDQDLIRLLFLSANVERLLHTVEGAFAEVGTYKGNTAKILHELAPLRKLYLFDTFQGFDERDIAIDNKQKINRENFTDTSLDKVRAFLGNGKNLHFYPGYFPESAKDVPKEERFALVHLDADLYQPTIEGLRYFYPKANVGALFLIHDYSSGAWPGVTSAVDEFMKDKKESLILMPDKSGSVLFTKQK